MVANFTYYIYCHPQIDCFVVSQLFNVARHVGRSKLGSKLAQLYKVLSSRVSLFTFYTLRDTRVLNSFDESHLQTVSLNHSSYCWLELRDASSRDRNPADFTSVVLG